MAPNTQASYRDTIKLLLPFVAQSTRKLPDQLLVEDLSADRVRQFLIHLEKVRRCTITTRNQRLAAIHALARFIGQHSPEHLAWTAELCAVPFKKAPKPILPYLEKSEMDAILAAPDRQTAQGYRDYALLLFLYNSGARAEEAARLTISNLNLGPSPSVSILGKGNKTRLCPLWTWTARTIALLVEGRSPSEQVFLNRLGQPLTRFGVYTLVKRTIARAIKKAPSLADKRVGPHTIRHTTAVHLLRSGVDINTIRAWLGHVSLNTTNVYAEVDLQIKAKALAHCEVSGTRKGRKRWREDPNLMDFLKSLQRTSYGPPAGVRGGNGHFRSP
ncbi:MAG: tyrosine-type recombinase/integrase [Anaerolineae bacterium]